MTDLLKAHQWKEVRIYTECPLCGEVIDGEDGGWNPDEVVTCQHCGKDFLIEGRP